MNLKLFFVFFKLPFMLALTAAEECEQTDSCSCKTSKYTVSLHSMAEKSNPRFTVNGDVYSYTYQPCNALASSCEGRDDVAICQHSESSSYAAGLANSSRFTGNLEDSNLVLTYHALTETNRISLFYLMCSSDEAGSLSFVNATYFPSLKETKYYFNLTAKTFCVSRNKLSMGSILLIIFLVSLTVYFIAGFLFLKFVRGAQGLELIPNYEFWSILPGHIKDGVFFTFRGFKTGGTYSKI